ncbi:hypothetical protein NHG97_26075, partial [Pseudomonas corrugata]|uniref:hypothetical protein n=1 Tax=Pseudomonas corrugata TaxID=47879 RepID=UPI0028C41AC6
RRKTAQEALSGLSVILEAVSFWLAYMHLLLMLCPNTKFLTPSGLVLEQGLVWEQGLPAINTTRFP